jgi:hypothetical protein
MRFPGPGPAPSARIAAAHSQFNRILSAAGRSGPSQVVLALAAKLFRRWSESVLSTSTTCRSESPESGPTGPVRDSVTDTVHSASAASAGSQ